MLDIVRRSGKFSSVSLQLEQEALDPAQVVNGPDHFPDILVVDARNLNIRQDARHISPKRKRC